MEQRERDVETDAEIDAAMSTWECLFVHREQGFFFSVYVDDMKMGGKQQNLAPTWNIDEKTFDLDEPTSLLGNVLLGCTQRECKPNVITIEEFTKVLESRILRWSN